MFHCNLCYLVLLISVKCECMKFSMVGDNWGPCWFVESSSFVHSGACNDGDLKAHLQGLQPGFS